MSIQNDEWIESICEKVRNDEPQLIDINDYADMKIFRNIHYTISIFEKDLSIEFLQKGKCFKITKREN